MKRLICLCIALLASVASATTVEWSAVTQYTDNTAIEPTKPVTYQVYRGTSPDNTTYQAFGAPTTGLSMSFNPASSLVRGETYFFSATATVDGVPSLFSPAVPWVFQKGTPVNPKIRLW